MSGFIISTSGMSYASGNQCGVASWYAAGSRTANGERMNANGMTAAHKSLPFGTVVRVIDQQSGRSIQVRINDRGPFVRGRIIDLTRAAAQRLGLKGIGKVCIAKV
ncbi:MAG: septal ring lytic transglycosylase RlpA family protein [Devosia sp.]|nr:septal ring lytic transglycosylase RlpA family protein [Devosia sp.]